MTTTTSTYEPFEPVKMAWTTHKYKYLVRPHDFKRTARFILSYFFYLHRLHLRSFFFLVADTT
jgi:hypothetical protein